MQALIDFLVRNIMAFWPFALVYSWQIGLRIRLGTVREELQPGLHWRWPFIDEIYRMGATETTIDLRFGSIATKDNKSVTISANIAYRVLSPRTMWTTVSDVEDSIANIALGKLAALCSTKEWDQLRRNRSGIRNWLRKELTKETGGWGIEVTRVFLTDCVQARQIRLLSDAVAAPEHEAA